MLKVQSFGFFIISLLVFSGVAIYGLFHLEEPNPLYWSILGVSAIAFGVGLLGFTYAGIRELVRDYRRHGNIWSFLYDFFASLKLAIFIMLLLGVFSMLGSTYIQQNLTFQEYVDKFGVEKAVWFWRFWLNDVFHSWYYIALIVLLAVNLTVCSIKRLPRIWKQTFGSERVLKLTEAREKHLKPISMKVSSKESLINFLAQKGFKVFMEEEEGKTYIFAEKGRYSRLGVYIVHIALLIIMAGALIDAIFGVRGTLPVPEGGAEDVMFVGAEGKPYKLPFAIHLIDFRIKTYKDENPNVSESIAMAISSYESDIEIINEGEKVASGTVKVNEPFDYGRYRIFQASYGLTGGVKSMGLVIVDKELAEKDPENAVVGTLELGSGKVGEFKDMLLSIDRVVLNIHNPDSGMDGELAPAVVVKVLKNRKSYNVPVIYDPQLNVMVYGEMEDLKDFPYVFFMDGFEPQFYSGFQISYHPGTWVIWTGSIFLVLGMMLAFYTIHRKVWIRIEGDTAKVAFYSHKFKEEFKRSFIKELEQVHRR